MPDRIDHPGAPSRGTPGARPRGAFSLLELLVVLAIIATASAIAVPRYAQSLERYRVDAAARRLVADLAYARSEAMATRTSRTVAFQPAVETYTLVGIAEPGHGVTPYVVDVAPEHMDIVSAVFDDASSALDPTHEVVFNGFGIPDSDGAVVLAAGDDTRTVVLAVTGIAEVQ